MNIRACRDTYIELGHPDVYEGTQHNHKIESIPWITKIVLKVNISLCSP